MKGDSFRRQFEASRKFAEKLGVDLDDTLTFQDLGVSAFRGGNIEEGALGAFIKAVDRGKVKPGSYLLVESLDRLSRQNVMKAFGLFSDILNHGVNIVTVQDGKVYSADQGEMDFPDVMMSLVVMQRAHEESLTKSKRLKAAWKAKRDKAQDGKLKLTARCPAWLMLNKDDNSFKAMKSRVATIKRIFKMSVDGIGKNSIARQFNAENVPTFGRSNGWQISYIQKILENEAVIGAYQPHKIKVVKGKKIRVADGEPIEGYFPGVVDKATFYKAKRMRSERRIPIGKTGANFSNIFTGLAVCGNCGGTMHFENKGPRPKGGMYLVCSNARRKVGNCKRHSWKYPETQAHIILNLNELDFRELLPDVYERSQEAVESLGDAILVKEAELEGTIKALDNIADAIADRSKSRALLNKLDEFEAKKDRLETELETLKSDLEHEREQTRAASQKYEEITDALEKFIKLERKGNQKKVYEVRRRLNQLLKKVIDRITFHPIIDGGLYPDADSLHGNIEISFQGVDEYCRLVQVETGQKNSKGYKVSNGESTFQVAVVDAQWPPVDRIVSGAFLEKEILGK